MQQSLVVVWLQCLLSTGLVCLSTIFSVVCTCLWPSSGSWLICSCLCMLVCWRYSSTVRKPGPLRSLTGSDLIHFTHDVNDESFTSDGTITLPMTKSYRSPHGLIYRPQMKAWTVRSRCQTRRWCSSKPYPPDLLQSSRRHPAITRLHAQGRPLTTWIHQIRRDTGISVTDALELAGDRSFWRQIATAGCYSWSLLAMMMMMMICMFAVQTKTKKVFHKQFFCLLWLFTTVQ